MLDEATAADLPAIVALYNDVIATTTAIYRDRDDPMTLADRAAWLATGTPIALGSYGPFKASPPGYATTVEHTVLVAPAHRGGGLGTTLVEALVAHATARGFHMMVGLIDAANTGSIRLHERLGFTPRGRLPEIARKDGAWVDLVIVQRPLAP